MIRAQKKRGTWLLPVPRSEAFALPNILEPTTRSPRRYIIIATSVNSTQEYAHNNSRTT